MDQKRSTGMDRQSLIRLIRETARLINEAETERLKPLTASGPVAERHTRQYIAPFHGGEQGFTHKIVSDDRETGLKAGTEVSIVSSHVENGKHYTTVKAKDREGTFKVINSKLNKPRHLIKDVAQPGLSKEVELARKLQEAGIMAKGASTAGQTHGNDFHLIKVDNEGKRSRLRGRQSRKIPTPKEIFGESKIGFGAKFGEVSLAHSDEKGWHIPDHVRAKRPLFAALVERQTVNGKPVFQHLNEVWGKPERGGKNPRQVMADETDLNPAHAYLEDHHVHVLHVHSHGTYRAGLSRAQDQTGIGLPEFEGRGRMVFRSPGVGRTRRAYFTVKRKSVAKSGFDLMNPEHLQIAREKLGHK